MRFRHTVFTINNYTDYALECLKEFGASEKVRYLVYGKEVGAQGTAHLQCYVELYSQIGMKALKKAVGGHAHLGERRGSAAEAAGYCKKGDGPKPEAGYAEYFEHPHTTWDGEEFGELSQQGRRTDLESVKDDIMAGKRTLDQITVEEPMLFHQYGRTLSAVEDIALRKKARTEMTKGIWYWGPSGVGKSHQAFKGFHPDTHYNKPLEDAWWDGYKGQETVIFNEFRACHLKFSTLLALVDKWPYSVPRRGREPVPFMAKTFIVTSIMHPREVFRALEEDESWQQFERRFEVVHLENCSEVLRG